MTFELELPRFQFVLLALVLLACIAVPCTVAAQATSQTQPQPACPPPATSEVSKAANSISNLGSIFGKKKAAQNAGQVANVAGGCDAKVNTATPDVGTIGGTTVATGSAANSSSAAPTTTLSSSAAAQPTSAPTSSKAQRTAAPYVPPSDAPAAFTGPLDPSKLPDISGIHLGMNLEDAKAALQKLYPNARIDVMNGVFLGPQHVSFVGLYRVQRDSTGLDQAQLDFTATPNPQVVSHMTRIAQQPHVAHNVLVAALRQKYGKETYATGPAQGRDTNDSEIMQM